MPATCTSLGDQSRLSLTSRVAITSWPDFLAWRQAPALVLGHFDTVWPKGTIDRMPFRVEADGRAFGPGIFDMKAGLASLWWALSVLMNARYLDRRPIWALLTSDEEIGSPTSRGLIEDLARQCAYVLVLEPPLADGGLKTARKGVGRFRLKIEGKAAHAGVAPTEGRSAIIELAHQIFAIQQLQDLAREPRSTSGSLPAGRLRMSCPHRLRLRSTYELCPRAKPRA